MKTLFAFIPVLLLTLPVTAQEDAAAQLAQAKANEQRLRDTLRTTTQQLRTIEGEKATLTTNVAERDQKLADVEARLAKLEKQQADDRAGAAARETAFERKIGAAEAETGRLATTLDKWKKAYEQAAVVAKKTEVERSRLSGINITLERTVADRERQNLELYKTGAEILQRYRDFGYGRALAAREPFTGLARARLEEQVQDYADKFQDHKLKPTPGDGKPSTKPN